VAIIHSHFIIILAVVLSLVFPISASALTPAADLTGEWSGLFQVKIIDKQYGGDCDISGKINANVIQNGNQLDVQYKTVINYSDDCGWSDDNKRIFGTIDGSRISLNDPLYGEFSGWFASSGIKLEAKTHIANLPGIPGPLITPGYDITFKTQLSPTNFTPPQFTKSDQDNDGIFDANDKCPTKAETKNGYQDEDGCPDVLPQKEDDKVKDSTDVFDDQTTDKLKSLAKTLQNKKPLFDPNAKDAFDQDYITNPPKYPHLPILGKLTTSSDVIVISIDGERDDDDGRRKCHWC